MKIVTNREIPASIPGKVCSTKNKEKKKNSSIEGLASGRNRYLGVNCHGYD